MIESTTFLAIIKIVALFIKCYFVYKILTFKSNSRALQTLYNLLALVLFFNIAPELSWLIRLVHKMQLPLIPKPHKTIVLLALRLAWPLGVFEYLFFGLFIEHLVRKKFTLHIRHYAAILITSIISLIFLKISIFDFHLIQPQDRVFEYLLYSFLTCYIPLSILPSIYSALRALRKHAYPKIIKEQLKTLIYYFLAPHIILIFLISNPFTLSKLQAISQDKYLLIAINDFINILMIHFCARRMLGLRFLSVKKHVQSSQKYNFIDNFKDVLTRLGRVLSVEELAYITQSFFQQAFRVSPHAVHLFIRQHEATSSETTTHNGSTLPQIERLLFDENHKKTVEHIEASRILIRDEIEFDYFYEESEHHRNLLQLLSDIEADILLPLYERSSLVGYIVIARNARPQQLFSNVERDEMCVFATYLTAIVYLLQHRNLTALMRQEAAWQEDIYLKQQEINHYKESIRTILKTSAQRTIGIIHINRRTLSWGNETIRTMLDIRSEHEEHPVYSSALKRLAHEALRYGIERSITLKSPTNRPILFTATPHAEKQALILAYYADIADAFTIPFDMLEDISSWEYALYLETTHSGKLINSVIPGSSKALLNFKIALLKIALSKKGILLELPEDDIASIVTIIHHISLRSQLHTITLSKIETGHDVSMQLFGIEPIASTDAQDGLLLALNNTGTLCIRNIEFLSPDTQQRLAHYLQTGLFHPIRSDRVIRSTVRIICTTSTNLELLIEQKKFSKELYLELRNASLALPSLLTMPRNELAQLAQHMTKHTLQTQELEPLMSLTERETEEIIHQAPVSLHELRQQVHSILHHKSSKQGIEHIVQLDSADAQLNPEVAQAIRLGKRALKDRYLLSLLWNTFQSQAKIATLLNVNRSSVNRRCREFNIP